ncbi:MAG: TIGR03000 domain-containing protein [Planctomycetes bacterium]|nr:TIGR03000 domain-containing protein [Planctomycetota bacterium]
MVRVPADAKVFINGYQMKSTSTERVFTSPNLEPNGSYYYTVRVVGEKGGKAIDESQRVSIRAGQTSQVAFDALPSPYRDDRTVTVIEPTKAPIK